MNEKFAERVELLKAAAEVDYLTQKKLEVESNIENIKRRKNERKEEVASGSEWGVNVLWNGIKK